MEKPWRCENIEKIKDLREIFEVQVKVFADSNKGREEVKRILRLGWTFMPLILID